MNEPLINFPFLGLIINDKLDWSHHVSNLSKSAARGIGVMKRLKPYIPKSALRNVYFGLVHSHLQYQILNWGYKSDTVEKLQKRAVRILASEHYLAHAEPLMKNEKILKITDMHKLTQLKLYHHHIHGNLPPYFKCIRFPKNRDQHSVNTRFQDRLVNPKPRHEFARKIPRNSIPNLVNDLEPTLRNAVETWTLSNSSHHYSKIKRFHLTPATSTVGDLIAMLVLVSNSV